MFTSVSTPAAVPAEGVDPADPGDVGVGHHGHVARHADVEVADVAVDGDLAAVQQPRVRHVGQVEHDLTDVH